jgi:hypothetical protein
MQMYRARRPEGIVVQWRDTLPGPGGGIPVSIESLLSVHGFFRQRLLLKRGPLVQSA